jgi:hypothetical protein
MPLTVDLSTLPELTKAEIARHNSDGDLWITIQGRVYDLSKFSAVHPGGELSPPNSKYVQIAHSVVAVGLCGMLLRGSLLPGAFRQKRPA